MVKKRRWAQVTYFSERKNTLIGFIHPSESQLKPVIVTGWRYLCTLMNKGFRVLDGF